MIFEKQFSQYQGKFNRLERRASDLSPSMNRPIQPKQSTDQSYFAMKNQTGMTLNSPYLQKKESEGHSPTLRPPTMEYLSVNAEPKKPEAVKVGTQKVDAIKVNVKNV